MMETVRVTTVLLVLAACGGSSGPKSPQDAAREAAAAQRKQLESERPERPMELRQRIAFRPPERCGQGPYRIETPALAARYAEELRVYACGLHDIAGNYRYAVHREGKPPRTTSEAAFGWGDRDNAACKANRGSSTQLGGGDAAAPGSSPGPSSSTTSVDAAAVAVEQAVDMKNVSLERVTSIPTSCTARIEIINMTHMAEGDYPGVEGRLVLDIWSEVPNDYEGMVFVVEQHAVAGDMTADRWTAYLEAERAWRVRYHAFLDGEVSVGRMTVADTKVTAPPPPPPRDETKPPKPSKNARWIPGYWLYEESRFHWIAGLWDVPQTDIEQELTVVAPKPPPPAPPPTVVVEKPAEPQPIATAVWTPGHWQWDGRAYVWVQGAWRIPPSQQSTWAPARWSITTRGAIFVPGRWSSGGPGRVRDHRRR
jgi:hypothetical protein